MVSELARGRVSKFLLVDLLFTLRIARLNPPQVFYWFDFPGLSYSCVFYFPLLYIDMIYLC